MANTSSHPARTGRSAAVRKGNSARRSRPAPFNKDVACISFIVAAALLFLILIWPKDEFSSLSSFLRFFTGLFGSMFWSLPIVCALGSFFAYRSNGDRGFFVKSIVSVFSLYLLLLTIVEAFHVDTITRSMEISGSYMNFLTFAYRANVGGGAVGALLAWPFHAFMGQWGALLICLFLSVIILFAAGAFSLEAVMSQIGSLTSRTDEPDTAEPERTEKKAPAKKITPKAEPVRKPAYKAPASAKKPAASASFHEDVFEVKPAARSKKKPMPSYDEPYLDDYGVNTSAPVRLPNLKSTPAPSRRPLKSDDDGFEIPSVHSDGRDPYAEFFEKPVKKRPASKPAAASPEKKKASAKAPKIEKIDLMEAVRSESPEERNRKYVKSALSDHSKAPKPVLSYSTEKTKSAAMSPRAKTANTVEVENDPSLAFAFSDDSPVKMPEKVREKTKEEAPVIIRCEEKPSPAVRPAEAKPRAVEEIPVKKEPPAPKPSFFDEPAPEKKEEYVPKTTLAGMKTEVNEEYDFPPIDLMETGGVPTASDGYEAGDMQRAEKLVETLRSFSIPVKITGISHGPAVTRFELLPAPGIKVSKIASYADDIAMNLAAESVRIEAPIPGKSAVGVELPNLKKEIVHLRDVLESPEARKAASRLAVALGKDNSGKYVVADLASMPHVLIAGQTGSGKSVCINAIIISILYRATPEEVRMIMIDPKMVELNAYNTIPHLLVPVVTDPKKAASALDWAVSEMTRRYKEFAAHGAKNIQSYNKKLPAGEKPMPQIVIIVDELADLMMTAPHDVEEAINRLAQLARAAGMHLVIATQRPSVNVITGVIKANIPTRIAFTVASGVDSRTILDSYGAESLLGKGDMLYLPPDRNKPLRIQGAWVSENEVQEVVDYISSTHDTNFDEDILEHMENAVLSDAEKSDKQKEEADDQVDELFPVAVKAVMDAGQASISMLQRKLRVGYARAGRLIDDMASRGLVSQSEGSKSREVLITREQYYELFGDTGDDYT